MRKTLLALTLVGLVSAAVAAQFPAGAAGFHWSGSSGASAGAFCWGFSCQASPVTVTAGEQVTLTTRGAIGAPYAILISFGASNCQSFPGVLNSLVLDQPVQAVVFGVLSQISPILACPSGFDTFVTTFPNTVPTGFTFAIQALTYGEGFLPAFTQAIAVTVI